MTFYNESGTRLTETTFNDLTEDVTSSQMVRFTADVYQSYTLAEGSGGFERASRLAFVEGQVVPQSMIDGLFETATFASITPASGPAAGGTAVKIKGTNFSGTAGVTFDGAAATNFKVVDNETITCTTPAGVAGTADLVIQDDAGDVNAAAAYTYA